VTAAVSAAPEVFEKAAAGLDAARAVVVAGATDTGKSTFCAFLANRHFAAGRRVAVLDVDLGQSDVGPPYCVGLLVMNDAAPDLSRAVPTAIHFVGHGSPSGLEARTLDGVRRLLGKAREERKADRLVVNTPGWVDGEAARAFLKSVIEAVAPDKLAVFQREREGEALASLAAAGRCMLLKAPAEAAPVSTEDRTAYRRESLSRYYRNGRLLVLPFHHVRTDGSLFLSGQAEKPCLEKVLHAERLKDGTALAVVREPLTAEEEEKARREYGAARLVALPEGFEKGVQAGLLDEDGETLAMGLARRIDHAQEFMEFWTPLATGKEGKVKEVRFGPWRFGAEFDEAAAVEAGTI
jgi:polynucleotide 5'-hydroxyl-kinase GRC3/NOL9